MGRVDGFHRQTCRRSLEEGRIQMKALEPGVSEPAGKSSPSDYDNTRYLHEHGLEIEQQEQGKRLPDCGMKLECPECWGPTDEPDTPCPYCRERETLRELREQNSKQRIKEEYGR